MKLTTNRLVNHVTWIIDKSGSMSGLSNDVIKVFDSQIKHLAKRSQEMDQETRITIYLFDNKVECLVYDIDVLRLPSLSEYYKTGGNTALIDAMLKSLQDLGKSTQLYGDHSYLIFCQTDGFENASRNNPATLSQEIKQLPENWTLAVLVPDQSSVHECKNMGFPANNIQIWSTTKDGLEESGRVIQKATEAFMSNRALGIRGTKNLFNLDTTKLTKSTIKKKLQELSPKDYSLLPISKECAIKDFVESWGIDYRPGSAYYMLSKPEKIQPYKQLVIQDNSNGKMYSGKDARDLLGLPDYEIKVSPASHGNYIIYSQSTSVNRKLVKGTQLLVMK